MNFRFLGTLTSSTPVSSEWPISGDDSGVTYQPVITIQPPAMADVPKTHIGSR